VLTAELSLGFLCLLFVASLAGLEPRGLLAFPPLGVVAAFGPFAALLAELIAYMMLFAAYEVVGLAALSAAGWLLGDPGQERIRRSVAIGRDTTALKPAIWGTVVGMPLAIAALLLFADPTDLPQLLFVGLLVSLTAAQTLRPFTFGDWWRGVRRQGAHTRDLSRPPGAGAASLVPVVPDPPPLGRAARVARELEGDWFDAAPVPRREEG